MSLNHATALVVLSSVGEFYDLTILSDFLSRYYKRMLLNWWCCRMIAYLLHLPPIPSTPANPYTVWSIITQTRDGWGRQVVFVSWLVNVFGVLAARRIWQHIRRRSQCSCRQGQHESQEEVVSSTV